MIGSNTDKTNFPYKLLLTDWQTSKLRNTFAYNSSVDIDLSKLETSKMIQFGRLCYLLNRYCI